MSNILLGSLQKGAALPGSPEALLSAVRASFGPASDGAGESGGFERLLGLARDGASVTVETAAAGTVSAQRAAAQGDIGAGSLPSAAAPSAVTDLAQRAAIFDTHGVVFQPANAAGLAGAGTGQPAALPGEQNADAIADAEPSHQPAGPLANDASRVLADPVSAAAKILGAWTAPVAAGAASASKDTGSTGKDGLPAPVAEEAAQGPVPPDRSSTPAEAAPREGLALDPAIAAPGVIAAASKEAAPASPAVAFAAAAVPAMTPRTAPTAPVTDKEPAPKAVAAHGVAALEQERKADGEIKTSAELQGERPASPAQVAARARDTAFGPTAASPALSGKSSLRSAGADGMTALAAPQLPQIHAPAVTDAARPAQVAERLLDVSGDDGWIDQLASDILATKSDAGEINFRLMPRHLGRLDIAMHQGEDGVALKMETQTETAATIVGAAQGRLVEELRAQGVRVTGSEVTHNPAEAGRNFSQGQGRGQAPSPAHLIETASEHGEAGAERQGDGRGGDRRGRFA